MKKKVSTKENSDNNSGFALGRENYILMATGFAFMVIGYILMIGGRSDDPEVFNPEIFSFRRITLAPLVLLFGIVFEVYAILKKPKSSE
jgi:hypothetical protein